MPRNRGRVIGIATASTGKAMPHWHLVQWQDGYLGQYLMGQDDKHQRFELAIPTHDQGKSDLVAYNTGGCGCMPLAP